MKCNSECLTRLANWSNDVVVWEPGVIVNVSGLVTRELMLEVKAESGVSRSSPDLVDVEGVSELDASEEESLGSSCTSEFWATRHATQLQPCCRLLRAVALKPT